MISKDQEERFTTVLRKVVREFYTDDAQKSNSYGRIINTRQFDRLKALLETCDSKSIVTGGDTNREDLYIAPTIVKDVTNDSPLMKDELFGTFFSLITNPCTSLTDMIQILQVLFFQCWLSRIWKKPLPLSTLGMYVDRILKNRHLTQFHTVIIHWHCMSLPIRVRLTTTVSIALHTTFNIVPNLLYSYSSR